MRWLARAALLLSICASYAYAGPDQIPKDPTAKDREAEAKEHFELGKKHYEAGEYEQAITEYQAALDLAPVNALLFNIGQAYRLKGDREKALDYYQKYVAAEPYGSVTNEALLHINEITRALAEEARAKQEEFRRQEEAKQREREERERAEKEQRLKQDARAKEHENAARKPRNFKIAGVAVAGAGVLSLAASVGFGIAAKHHADEITDARGQWTTNLDAAVKAGRADDRDMYIFTGLGVAALAGGAVLYYLGLKEGERVAIRFGEVSASVEPSFGRNCAGLAMRGQF